MSTQLTVIQRAAVALGTAEHEIKLRELVTASAGITEIKNKDAREEAHRAGMTLRTARTSIAKAGKEARDDANAFAKAVIAEEKRLAEIVEPEEKRVLALRDAWDAKIEAERQAKIEAEKARVAGIQKQIANIRALPLSYAAANATVIADGIQMTTGFDIDEATYAEFLPHAVAAQAEAIEALQKLHAQAVEREAEIARVKAEQEAEAERLEKEKAELERIRAETVERERKEKERRAVEAAKEKAEREAAAAKLAKEQAATKAKLESQRAEAVAMLAAIEAEREALAKQKADQEKADREKAEAAEAAERAKAEAIEREAAEAALVEKAKQEAPAVAPAHSVVQSAPAPQAVYHMPPVDEIIDVLAEHYQVPPYVVEGWLQQIEIVAAA